MPRLDIHPSGVSGNLNEGEAANNDAPESLMSAAWVEEIPSTPPVWGLGVNGGAYTTSGGAREWTYNTVDAGTTCFPLPTSAQGLWVSSPCDPGPAAPQWIADIVDTREVVRLCFLSGLEAGDGQWNSAGSYALVHAVATADPPLYPTPGWYVESNACDTYADSQAAVAASCVDFPSPTFWDPNEGPGTWTVTSGTGVKACGLAYIEGALNTNDTTNGVYISSPAGNDPNGNWSVTVSAGHRGQPICVQ